jgi:hypothetical protein
MTCATTHKVKENKQHTIFLAGLVAEVEEIKDEITTTITLGHIACGTPILTLVTTSVRAYRTKRHSLLHAQWNTFVVTMHNKSKFTKLSEVKRPF